jgi:hypothetical protein
LVCACCKICPNDLGKYLKFCWSNDDDVELLLKLKDARRAFPGSGRRRSCSLYADVEEDAVVRWENAVSAEAKRREK